MTLNKMVLAELLDEPTSVMVGKGSPGIYVEPVMVDGKPKVRIVTTSEFDELGIARTLDMIVDMMLND